MDTEDPGQRTQPTPPRTSVAPLNHVVYFLTVEVEGNMPAGRRREKGMRYRVVLTTDEDGVYAAECPSLPGCISQGATRELALQNVQEAMTGYLESLKKHGDPIPPSIGEEIVEVNV